MKVLFIFGTRPEAIKMAPVIKTLEADIKFGIKVCVTAQHRQMLDQVLTLFDIVPDYDLDLMSQNQDLFDVTSKVIMGIRDVLLRDRPDLVLVQGDTTSCFAGALAAFYMHIPIGHIEAGLRTYNITAPFPEEANRVMTSRLAQLHFAPTESSRNNLLNEKVPADRIWVTGNTVIDALFMVRQRVSEQQNGQDVYGSAASIIDLRKPYVLITGHRRENFGMGFQNICDAIAILASKHPNIHFVFPVHLNPNVNKQIFSLLSNQRNIHLIKPLDYAPFVNAMDRAILILTDSGGVQEEGPSLGKPVLVMRDTTERPEAVDAGTVILVGTDKHRIVTETERLLNSKRFYQQMARKHNPYGDGKAAIRIKEILLKFFEMN